MPHFCVVEVLRGNKRDDDGDDDDGDNDDGDGDDVDDDDGKKEDDAKEAIQLEWRAHGETHPFALQLLLPQSQVLAAAEVRRTSVRVCVWGEEESYLSVSNKSSASKHLQLRHE